MEKESGVKNVIVELSFEFAVDVIRYTEQLENLRKYNLSNQLFRSGTSIGANVNEAQGAESRADFIHKMKIAYKEAQETSYWLNLCAVSKTYPDPQNLISKAGTIQKILGKILATSINKRS